MPTDKKPEDQVTDDGAVELEESELDKASGGIVVIAVSHEVKSAAFADGSVRFITESIG